jgi:hypothetical protein
MRGSPPTSAMPLGGAGGGPTAATVARVAVAGGSATRGGAPLAPMRVRGPSDERGASEQTEGTQRTGQ